MAAQVLDAPPTGERHAGPGNSQARSPISRALLQELAQSRKLPQPRYAIVRELGPEHSKTFTVEVRVGKEWTGQGEGATKKVAAQRAARQVYQRLREEPVETTPTP